MELTKENERALTKLLRTLREKAKKSWYEYNRLQWEFGESPDNDARNPEFNGEPPMGETFK